MKIKHTTVLFALFTITACGYAAEYQYAEFSEISYTSKNRNPAYILSFITDPGYPILVMSKEADPLLVKSATYSELYKQCNITGSDPVDAIRALNAFGKMGWEVISVTESDQTVFLEKLPSHTIKYLMKKSIK